MKRIVDGKVYDTDTARLLCKRPVLDETGNWIESHTLYRTIKGAYFVVVVDNPSDKRICNDYISVISESEAKKIIETYGSFDDYVKVWGIPEEA